MRIGTRYLLGLATGLLVLAVGGATAFAQTPPPAADQTPANPYCAPGMGGGHWGGAFGALNSVADLLGLDAAQIAEERQAGKSLADIAQERGVGADTLVEAIVADREALLAERVADGTLSQEQADFMLQRMTEQAQAAVERTAVGPMGPAHGARGVGRMGPLNGADGTDRMGPGGRGMYWQDQGEAPAPRQGFGPRMGGFGGGFNR